MIPLDFAYTGFYVYDTGKLSYEAANGVFWSRTASSSAYAYYLSFFSGSVNPQNDGYRGFGIPLRCTAK